MRRKPKASYKVSYYALRIEKQQLRREAEELRAKRWGVHQHRAQKDAAWQPLRLVRRTQQEKRLTLRQVNKRPTWGSQAAENQHFKQLCQQRRTQIQQRTVEQWRKARQQRRLRLSQLPLVTTWIAILVITDNCTRQCLGLPMFIAGANVTAEMVVSVLRGLLPT